MAKLPLTTATQAKVKLKVGIAGAGLGGLAAAVALARRGHNVTVFERAPAIVEIGAGINVSPNLSRLLDRWGLDSTIRELGCTLESVDVRRWKDGSILSSVPMMPGIGDKYGAAAYVVHRADFQNILLAACHQLDVLIREGSAVIDVDFTKASVTLESGSAANFDFVIGADGIKSLLRAKLLRTKFKKEDKLHVSGDSAYRIIIKISEIPKEDRELLDLVVPMKGTRWIGPGCHLMAYPLRKGELYNLVLLHPDHQSTGQVSWTAKATKADVLKLYQEWDPLLLRLIRNFLRENEVYEWQLTDLEELPGWTSGRFALMGDAAHAMLPYVAQGSAQAIEDAAVLGLVLSQLAKNNESEIGKAMVVYERLRKQRAEAVTNTAIAVRTILHLPDGPEQVARDEAFRKVREGGENPDSWQNERHQQELWGHDAEAGVVEAWHKVNQSYTLRASKPKI